MSEGLPQGAVGDGLHDDSAAIQRLLDARANVYLPPPPAAYCIGRPLTVHSGQTLRLDPTTVVRLSDGANSHLLQNADPAGGDRDITLLGGVWDGNNAAQTRQSQMCASVPYDPNRFIGAGLRLCNIRNLRVAGLTIKDPEGFAMQLGRLEQFTIEDITFDFNLLRPNMDGVHVHGPARFGRISNIKGACNDDHVALNADDGGACEMCRGPISDVHVDGVFSENGYTAVRLLSAGSPVSRIRVSNLFGTYRYHCVSFTHHNVHPGAASTFADVAIDGVFCSKPLTPPARPLDDHDWGLKQCPQIFVAPGVHVTNAHIRDLHRTETYPRAAADTILIDAGGRVDHLAVFDCSLVNRTEREMHLLTNRGEIGSLNMQGVFVRAEGPPRGRVVANSGAIGRSNLVNVVAENLASG